MSKRGAKVRVAAIQMGSAPEALNTPFGRVGLSVCYAVRFPELYRAAGVVLAELDAGRLAEVRQSLPALQHRTM